MRDCSPDPIFKNYLNIGNDLQENSSVQGNAFFSEFHKAFSEVFKKECFTDLSRKNLFLKTSNTCKCLIVV